ncbi:Proprotein convertase subtilisin/kexin type 6 [Geodia barretti]|uniref:Proprotein convertase subtilisin/kexin type 6 n=1 Tax=Geodia barretti TaxID=519541 RepID=A0AA35RVN4_GEOBA|nr:Proprotein convertase subtilisin/kexin type 6 [Geodia barretti]
MVVAYVTDDMGNSAIRTTDRRRDGYHMCTSTYGGTSASAPMVSGTIALALEANPNLTWRDVQYLIVYTADPHQTAGPLTRNGAGLAVSRQYGFGVMDAEAMVTRARHWINAPPQIEHHITAASQEPSSNTTYSATVNFTGKIQYLEHVVVTISVAIPENTFSLTRGDLQISLESPSGTLSILLRPRPNDKAPDRYVDWPFMSVMFWGENPTGQWTLNITTRDITGVAVVSEVEFHFYGVSQVPESVTNIPDQCHSDCKRGCAGEGSNLCDTCVNLRNAYTLECINECPSGYSNRRGYCYNESLAVKECNSPLKNKTGFNDGRVGCTKAGFKECCTNGNCAASPLEPSSCFCDTLCYKFKDCCDDIAEIGCPVENVTETFPYIDLGVTPGVETNHVDFEGRSPPIKILFPLGASIESHIYPMSVKLTMEIVNRSA